MPFFQWYSKWPGTWIRKRAIDGESINKNTKIVSGDSWPEQSHSMPNDSICSKQIAFLLWSNQNFDVEMLINERYVVIWWVTVKFPRCTFNHETDFDSKQTYSCLNSIRLGIYQTYIIYRRFSKSRKWFLKVWLKVQSKYASFQFLCFFAPFFGSFKTTTYESLTQAKISRMIICSPHRLF